MCSERRRVQEEMAVFVDLYEWRGRYTLQGFRPLLLPLLSYGRAVRSCTAAGILPTSAQLQPASDRRREATLSLWLHRFPPLPLPLPPPLPPHTFVWLRVYCAPPLSNQQQFRSSSTILKGFGGSSSRAKAPQPPSPRSPRSTFTFFLNWTGRENFNESVQCFADAFCGAQLRSPGRTGTELGIFALRTSRLGRSWVCRVLRCDFGVVLALFLESMRRFNREKSLVQNRKRISDQYFHILRHFSAALELYTFNASTLYSCERKRKQPLWEIQPLIRKH